MGREGWFETFFKTVLFFFYSIVFFYGCNFGSSSQEIEPEYFKSEVLLIPEGPSSVLESAIYGNKVITKASANKELGLNPIFEFDYSTKVLSFNARSVAELNRLVETTTTRIRAAALDIIEEELNAQRKSIKERLMGCSNISKTTNTKCTFTFLLCGS